ncbi:hypothetical protein GDO81_018377 [Engystomops pustulosus]|uniref:ZP domain-containing protein n=1 Tax=Engystomops pustulosus TaxID=76066 RepID=A0AAV7A6L2_ENGPU|nr:hypothetical protein GDO81_018377 [Engystomops pustulosus]
MYGHTVKIVLLWSLIPTFSNAAKLSSSSQLTEKCLLQPGQIQKTFAMVFMYNPKTSYSTKLYLYLVTCDKAARVTVTASQPSFNKTIQVDKDSSSRVTLDYPFMITESSITSKVVVISSNVAISVYAFYDGSNTADATACLPQEDLGQEYYISTPSLSSSASKEFSIANGFESIAHVNVTVSATITYGGVSYSKGKVLSLSLKQREVIQFQSSYDLTGTKISSSAPVAVFTGHSNNPGYNWKPTMEQLHPVKNWGTFFAVFPFLAHTSDIINIMASSNDTIVNVTSSSGTSTHNLQEGSHVQVTVNSIKLVNSTQPIMVSYLTNYAYTSSLRYYYEPFLTTVPPSLLGRQYYRFVTRSSHDNFLLIVSNTSSVSGFFIDGTPLSSYSTTKKEFNGFRGWEVKLGKTEGKHEIYHETSTFTFYAFGTGTYTSYGYSVGQFPNPEECSIRCLPHMAEYILPKSLLSEAHLDVLNVHLKDPQCKAVKEKDKYLIKIPFNRCGSSVLTEDGTTFYANTIYGTIPNTDVHRIEIPVRCEMHGNKSVELLINPKVNNVICKGYYNVSMQLYQSDSFTEPLTLYPRELDLHSSLHVEFKVVSEEKGLQILTETLTASPAPENTTRKYTVIQNGCRQDSTLQVHQVDDPRLQRFTFHLFKFDQSQDIYLAANVVICHNATSPNRCTKGCISPRLRRDVQASMEQLDTNTLSLGPFGYSSNKKNRLA